MFRLPLTLACVTLVAAACSSPSAEPSPTTTATTTAVTIDVCGTPVTWTAPPERVFVNDINMLEMLLALDLQDRIVATYLWGEDNTVLPELRTTMDDVYFDLRSLGAIFGVEDRAEALIAQYQATIQQAVALVPDDLEGRVDLFLYDSGDDEPFTAGFFAIPDEMFRLVGGRNVIDDVDKTWTAVSWERVISENPVLIPVVAYGGVTCDERIATLESLPALSEISAIVNRRYHCFEYADVVPGIRTADATLELARVLWTAS